MTSLARGPVGAEPPGAARPDGTREPDGTGHPALRGLPAVWLRANCPCAGCQDPRSGQRLAAITGLPADVSVARVLASDAAVEVIFGPDGHRAVFAADWLARYGGPGGEPGTGPGPDPPDDDRTEDAKRLWAAADLGGGIPQGWWPRYLADPEHRSACLSAVLTHGVVVLHDVPGEPGAVLAVARSLGYVRETNYGRLFDVRAEPAAANLAFTRRPIAPHTDNPYRDPVPTMQLLHCLRDAADGGGESGLVDGFRAAALLRETHPGHFRMLSGTPVTFAWGRLRAQRPMIGVDEAGRIREIRYNNRSLRPLAGREDELGAFYAAYRAFDALLNRPGAMVTFKLAPGDCVIFDNTRVLHARTAFTDGAGAGDRHLQGCYADLDAVQWTTS
ncbi:MAG TPA: TauD/TfdA family dioxygenase [Dactylosporangium sp.]|nr:TauD/TfdA family dioxygenase [Dactylosporangium sp.]